MPEWLKEFIGKYGIAGLVGLIALILVAQNAGLLPAAHELAASADKTSTAIADQMNTHIQQAKEQTKELKEIKEQLKQNHDTSAIGNRLMCLRLSKTDSQRDECAKIQ